MTTVLVTGILGKTGREVANALRHQLGVVVRGTSRNPDRDRPGSPLVYMDWDAPETWAPALSGVEAIYLLRPGLSSPGAIEAFLASATEARRVVLLSEIDAGNRAEDTWEQEAEAAVQSSNLDWTILRPNWFMQNFTDPGFYLEAIRDTGDLELPAGGGATSLVDTRDIGEVAATCLLDAIHAGRIYDLTGPQSFTWSEIARALAHSAGHDVRLVDPPLDDYLAKSAARGVSPASLEYYRRVYSAVQQGRTAPISPDVEVVTGHPPRTFAGFLVEHAPRWRR